jgi:ribosome modulation factor
MADSMLDIAWIKGFDSGQAFIKQCPFTQDSPEARNWFDGWNEGSSKTLGFPYSRSYTEKISGIKHKAGKWEAAAA